MTTTAAITRDTILAGVATVTVTLPSNFVVARAMLGEVWHPSYTFRVERVEGTYGSPIYFLSSIIGNRTAYIGVLHPTLGTVRFTRRSSFPKHATRVRVASRVLRALFAGKADSIERAGWTLDVDVTREDEKF